MLRILILFANLLAGLYVKTNYRMLFIYSPYV